MPQKIRIGIAGCGRAGMIHARNFAFRIKEASVSALIDPFSGNLEEAKKELGEIACFEDCRKAFDTAGLDAVLIASPTSCHRETCMAAAEKGINVFCEKPMAMNAGECTDMLAAVRKAGVIMQIGFMRRFDSAFIAAKEKIDSGHIGKVVMVRSVTYGPSIPKPWMYDLKKSNGPLAEVSSHDIDTLRWFTGSEMQEVYAIAGNYRCPDAVEKFPDFYDNVTLTAKFANGSQGIVNGAQGVGYGYDSRCEILGTEGVIFVGALDKCAITTCNRNGMLKPIVSGWQDLFLDAYLAEDRDFVSCIIEGREPRVTGVDGMAAVKVVNAGNLSIKSGKPVSIK